MDNLELALIRRVAVIDKIFYEHLNNNITIDLIKIVKLDFDRWLRHVVVTTTNNVILYSFELNLWETETHNIFNNLYKFISSKYRYELEKFFNNMV
jgi:hypothetical protein